jgi:Bardet-Biedl syndrome 9 protein
LRAIQKRLLNKFKDKTPTTLDNLDAILEATYRQITTLADRHEQNQRELNLASQSLSCATNLYILLIALSQNLTQEEIEILEFVLTPQIIDTPDLVNLSSFF